MNQTSAAQSPSSAPVPARGGRPPSARRGDLPRSSRWPLARRLTVAVVLLAIPLEIIVLLTALATLEERRQAEIGNAVLVGQALAAVIDGFTGDLQSTLVATALAVGSEPGPLDQDTVGDELQTVFAQYRALRTLFLTDPAGRVIATNANELVGFDLAGRSYIVALQGGAESAWSGGLTGAQTGETTVVHARVVRGADGGARAFLVAAFYPERLVQGLPVALPPDAQVVLLDDRGAVMYHSDPAAGPFDARASAEVRAAAAGTPARLDGQTPPGAREPVVGAFVPVPRPGWVVGYLRPRAAVERALAQSTLAQAGGIAVVIVVAAAIMIGLARRLAAPLAALAATADAIARGERPAIPAIGAYPELDRLSTAMQVMSAAVGEREAALLSQREWLQTTLTSIGDGVIATDAEGRVTLINATAAGLTGWSEAESLGFDVGSILDLRDERTGAPAESPIRRVLHEGVVVGLANHTILVARDGSERPIDDCAAPIRDADGTVLGAVMVFRDVTERRRAEARLAESRRHLDLALQSARMMAWDWDPATDRLTTSANVPEIYGVPEMTCAADAIAVIHPEDRAGRRATIERALATGEGYHAEFRVIRPDTGEIIWQEERGIAAFGPTGQPESLAGVVVDITRRKLAEQALAERERQYRRLAEAGIVGLIFWDIAGPVLNANDEFLKMLGYTQDDLAAGRIDWRALTPPEHQGADAENVRALLRDGHHAPYEKVYRHKDGTPVPVLVGSAFFEGSRKRGVSFVLDLTSRKRAEQALRESEERLRLAVAAAPVLLFALGPDDRYTWAARPFPGLTLEQMLGRTNDELFPPRIARALTALQRHARATGARATGEIAFEEEAAGVPGGAGADDDADEVPGAAGLIWTVTVEPLRDAAGEVVGLTGAAVDITERRALERLQHEFISMVSHELRNPLASIKGYGQLLQRRGIYFERAVQSIVQESDHLDRLISDLLDTSRVGAGRLELRRERADLLGVVVAAVERAQSQSPDHSFVLELEAAPGAGPAAPGAGPAAPGAGPAAPGAGPAAPGAGPAAPGAGPAAPGAGPATPGAGPAAPGSAPLLAEIDVQRLGQVLANLLSNAVKYAPDASDITVRVARVGGEAVVSVTDRGLGIAPEQLPRLFGRFFRATATAGQVQGLGIGLYVARELVVAHGGRIWAESDGPGRGATFAFALPLLAAPDPARPGTAPDEDGRAPVLVVDDDESLRALIVEALESEGYRTVEARDGLDALDRLAESRPAMILLDWMMPRMNAPAFAAELRRRAWADIPVVVMTAGGQAPERAARIDAAGYVSKPFELAGLLSQVARHAGPPAGDAG